MSLNKTTVLAASVLGVMVFGTAAAQNTPPAQKASSQAMKPAQSKQGKPSFEQLDRNHDGRLMRSEVPHKMHSLRAHFRQFDRDGNGALSKKEYRMFAHPPEIRRP